MRCKWTQWCRNETDNADGICDECQQPIGSPLDRANVMRNERLAKPDYEYPIDDDDSDGTRDGRSPSERRAVAYWAGSGRNE